MSYYFLKILALSFEDAIAKVTEELQKKDFGILTEIDVKDTLRKKTGSGFSQIYDSGSM